MFSITIDYPRNAGSKQHAKTAPEKRKAPSEKYHRYQPPSNLHPLYAIVPVVYCVVISLRFSTLHHFHTADTLAYISVAHSPPVLFNP